jgi:hypothetical protein
LQRRFKKELKKISEKMKLNAVVVVVVVVAYE